MNIGYRVGIIDDDPTKITQLLPSLKMVCKDDEGRVRNTKYTDYALIPKEIPLLSDEDDMIKVIMELHIDAIIIDYNLSSQEVIAYTGVSLAKKLADALYNFPIFILTSYQDDLYMHELFDAYQVFDFARYIAEPLERIELNTKIIEQIIKYTTEREVWEKELEAILPHAGESDSIDERILALDSQLEKTIDGKSRLSEKLRRELTSDKVQLLIDKIDKIIKG